MPVNAPWMNDPAGPIAREIQQIYWIMFAFAVVVLIIVVGGIVYSGIRFRERPGHTAKQFHGHNLLELIWTVVPVAMVVFFTVISFQRLQFINAASDADMTVRVEGRQWSWNYKYPEEAAFRLSGGTYLEGVEELHIPVDTKVRLELTATDVIHSFWVPQVGGKKDAVPGHTTEMWIQADRVGTFKGQCYEFCGQGHADMLVSLVVHSPADYAAWQRDAIARAERTNDPATAQGRELFRSLACSGCHVVQGLTGGRVGPELTNIASKPNIAGTSLTMTEENLIRWIENPGAVKPGTQMPALGLPREQVEAIAKFLMTLE